VKNGAGADLAYADFSFADFQFNCNPRLSDKGFEITELVRI